MKTILPLAFFLVQSAFGATPTETLAEFKKAAQAGDFEATWKHAAKFEGVSDQITGYLKDEVKEFIDLMKKGWGFEILDEKIDGDCAVVVVNESKGGKRKGLNLDPVYLLKQNGEWKVFPDVSHWELSERFAKDKVETYKKLEIWLKARKVELKKERAEVQE